MQQPPFPATQSQALGSSLPRFAQDDHNEVDMEVDMSGAGATVQQSRESEAAAWACQLDNTIISSGIREQDERNKEDVVLKDFEVGQASSQLSMVKLGIAPSAALVGNAPGPVARAATGASLHVAPFYAPSFPIVREDEEQVVDGEEAPVPRVLVSNGVASSTAVKPAIKTSQRRSPRDNDSLVKLDQITVDDGPGEPPAKRFRSSAASVSFQLPEQASTAVLSEKSLLHGKLEDALQREQEAQERLSAQQQPATDAVFARLAQALPSEVSLSVQLAALGRLRNELVAKIDVPSRLVAVEDEMKQHFREGNADAALGAFRRLEQDSIPIPEQVYQQLVLGLTFYFCIGDALVVLDKMQHNSALRPSQTILETILLGLCRCSLFKEATRRMILYSELYGFYPTLETWHNFIRSYMQAKRFSEALVAYGRIRTIPAIPVVGQSLRDLLLREEFVTNSLQPTSVTLLHLIQGYLSNGMVLEALGVLELVERDNIVPTIDLFLPFEQHWLDDSDPNMLVARKLLDYLERFREVRLELQLSHLLTDSHPLVLLATRLQSFIARRLEQDLPQFGSIEIALQQLGFLEFNTLLMSIIVRSVARHRDDVHTIFKFILVNRSQYLTIESNTRRLLKTLLACREGQLVDKLIEVYVQGVQLQRLRSSAWMDAYVVKYNESKRPSQLLLQQGNSGRGHVSIIIVCGVARLLKNYATYMYK